ncbi:cyclin-Q-like isoform X1 [Centruroides sculpturatus]|uniref:cyclin-Q-like isoform X1 n=1 Tax=Centruroides sculpturatus TaxID=218467 RepID=UPI000C6D9B0B|nr:cyclin-Q-like isoform X1 [Centruroides sculpturatus]
MAFLSERVRSLPVKPIYSVFEGGTKLEAQAITIATAATLYHRFFQQCSPEDYDPYLIAATSLYLAGKVEEDHLKIRDIINIFYKIVHKNSEPLSLGDEYWNLRDSIVNCELLMLRILRFKVSVNHPHRYLLHYLRSVMDWLSPEIIRKVPLSRTCWSMLCDHYLNPVCLKHKPQHVAVAIINLTLQCYAVNVPYNRDVISNWYECFCDDLSNDQLWDIMEDIMDVYEEES